MENRKDMKKRYEYPEKPEICPACGSDRIADILYGYPAFSDKLEEEIKKGHIVLGGCIVTGNDPAWKCLKCGLDIYRTRKA